MLKTILKSEIIFSRKKGDFMPTIIIGGLLAIYVFFVIRKKIKQVKAGQYCSCGCNDCNVSCNTKENK